MRWQVEIGLVTNGLLSTKKQPLVMAEIPADSPQAAMEVASAVAVLRSLEALNGTETESLTFYLTVSRIPTGPPPSKHF